ncbi:hypothetical protein ACWDFR_31470 [Streptomyces sp. 900105755]
MLEQEAVRAANRQLTRALSRHPYRDVVNRMIGQLYQRLQHGERFDELVAFLTPPSVTETTAA